MAVWRKKQNANVKKCILNRKPFALFSRQQVESNWCRTRTGWTFYTVSSSLSRISQATRLTYDKWNLFIAGTFKLGNFALYDLLRCYVLKSTTPSWLEVLLGAFSLLLLFSLKILRSRFYWYLYLVQQQNRICTIFGFKSGNIRSIEIKKYSKKV